MSNNDKKEVTFKDKNGDELLGELWERINQYGLLNASKNDIGDYIIYLLNKHCVYDKKERFFDKLPHARIEKILKINTARIKSAQNNIKVKYADTNDEKMLFDDFISDLLKDKIKFKKVNDDEIRFIIENKAKRSIIETKLKEISTDTLDNSFNDEIVTINTKNFIKMLKSQKDLPKEVMDKIKQFDENVFLKSFKKLSIGDIISLGGLALSIL